MEFTRATRSPAAEPAPEDIDVRTPPQVPRLTPGSVVTRIAPVLMLVAMAGMLVFYFRSGSVTGRNPMFLLFPAMMVLSLVGSTILGSRGARRAGEIDADRREYLLYLDALEECVGRTASEQHRWLYRNHPPPDALWNLAGTDRMWQRRWNDEDFTETRVGIGERPLRHRLVAAISGLLLYASWRIDIAMQPLRDRVARQPRDARDLAHRLLLAAMQPPDPANHVHGDHSSSSAAQKSSRVG